MKDLLIDGVRAAGRVLLEHFGRVREVRTKESHSSVVTEADLASERCLIELIRSRHPRHGIVAEESGFQPGSEPLAWVIDPLDGTSNFAAGIPWFGVLVAVLERGEPILGAAYLPVTDTLYWAEAGQGTYRDGVAVHVTGATELRDALCAFGIDATTDEEATQRAAGMLARLVNRSRNVRATNSLIDCCYTIDGRLGGWVNLATRIWDIAALRLMLQEAGGLLTDVSGVPIQFRLESEPFDRNYPVVGASHALHAQVLAAIR
jgi:myo-inositol-1(or 4)-monophosphatase